jgi:receptor protein-tyrosine kinase
VVQSRGERLSVIAAGPTPPNPGELLASSHMARLLEKLRGGTDYVLVDAPPILAVADSTGFAAAMDGVVLSVRHGSTRKEQLQQANEALQQVGAHVLGVVLNIVQRKAGIATARRYGYAYEPLSGSSGNRRHARRRKAADTGSTH